MNDDYAVRRNHAERMIARNLIFIVIIAIPVIMSDTMHDQEIIGLKMKQQFDLRFGIP